MSVDVLCLVRWDCFEWNGRGVVGAGGSCLRGCWSSLLVTCKPVGASGRHFAPDYTNGAVACASPSILHWRLSYYHSQLTSLSLVAVVTAL